MDILSLYNQLNPIQKRLLHMAFDEGTYELVRLELDGNEIFISVNHIDNPEFLVLETQNHWSIGKVNKCT